jgi:hypothetical protein
MKKKKKEERPHMATNEYLAPEVRGLLNFPIEKRIELIGRERYIPYQRAEHILSILEERYNLPKNIRPEGLLISGPSNNGKTTLLREFSLRHGINLQDKRESWLPTILDPGNDYKPSTTTTINEMIRRNLGTPILKSDVLPTFNGSDSIICDLLYQLYGEAGLRGTQNVKCLRLADALIRCGTRLIFIDEVQRIMRGKKRPGQTLDFFIDLSTRVQIPVVLAGIGKADELFSGENQASSRFPTAELPPWESGKELRILFAKLESTLPLRSQSFLYRYPKFDEIVNLSSKLDTQTGTQLLIGNAFNLAKKTAKLCLKRSEMSGSAEEMKLEDIRAAFESMPKTNLQPIPKARKSTWFAPDIEAKRA